VRSFWKLEKNEGKEKTASSEARMEQRDHSQNRTSAPLTLRQACQEFGRQDLEEALSWLINLEPRGRDLPNLLSANDRIHYSIAANVMVYEGRIEKAREYFKMALDRCDPDSNWRRELDIVLANLKDTVKIAQRYWELSGKGAVYVPKDSQSNQGRLRSGDASRTMEVIAE